MLVLLFVAQNKESEESERSVFSYRGYIRMARVYIISLMYVNILNVSAFCLHSSRSLAQTFRPLIKQPPYFFSRPFRPPATAPLPSPTPC